MSEKLEFIIDSTKNAIYIEDKIDNSKTTIYMSTNYKVLFDPKYPSLLSILLDSGKKRDDVAMNAFKRTFDDNIHKKYDNLTVRTFYSRKVESDVAEIFIPRDKYRIIIN